MSLQVRQLAWLHAVPKAPASKSVSKRNQEESKSRLKALTDKGLEPRQPGAACQYLIDHLLDVGPTMAGGMGPAPLDDDILQAWQHNNGLVLQPWEVRFMRRLSLEWIAQTAKAEDPSCRAPFGELSVPSRDEVARKIDELL